MASDDIPFIREHAFEYGTLETITPWLRRLTAPNPSPFTFHGTGTFVIGHGEVAVADPGPAIPAHVDALQTALEGEAISHIYDGDVIQGKGWTVECVHTPGHTPNHVCFSHRESASLMSGDHVMGWSTSIISPPDGDMGDYMRSLERLLERDETTYYPTHGSAITDPKRHVRAFIAHRQVREQQVRDAIDAGHQRIQDMVPVMYKGLDERLFPAAARSVLATILYLVERGELSYMGELDTTTSLHRR